MGFAASVRSLEFDLILTLRLQLPNIEIVWKGSERIPEILKTTLQAARLKLNLLPESLKLKSPEP